MAGERREGLYLVSPDRSLVLACTHPQSISISETNSSFSQLDIHFGARTPGQLLPFPIQAAAPPRRQTHVNQLQTRKRMAEEDEDDCCACCGSWNTYMGAYPGLHQKCDGGCGDWSCQECSFLCPGCGCRTCEHCTGCNLSRLHTASDDENPEHPLHRFIKLDMSFGNCELDESNMAGELYAGINPICSRHCADKMMVDLFVSGNGTEDEEYTTHSVQHDRSRQVEPFDRPAEAASGAAGLAHARCAQRAQTRW